MMQCGRSFPQGITASTRSGRTGPGRRAHQLALALDCPPLPTSVSQQPPPQPPEDQLKEGYWKRLLQVVVEGFLVCIKDNTFCWTNGSSRCLDVKR